MNYNENVKFSIFIILHQLFNQISLEPYPSAGSTPFQPEGKIFQKIFLYGKSELY